MTAPAPHCPVLLAEMLTALAPEQGGQFLDGTFGAGGYSRAILAAAPAAHLIGFDRDPEALVRAEALAAEAAGRFTFVSGRFGDLDERLDPDVRLDGIVLDIGVSSMQIDQAERGFSFAKDGPLDMRMERTGPSAADLVNTTAEAALADLIYRYGEERLSRRIARAIVTDRRLRPFTRTAELAELIRRVVPRPADGIDPATRTFQALRIAVNDELGELERALVAAERRLVPGGRLVVVTFHSLEDRLVKEFLRDRSGSAARPSRHHPLGEAGPAPSFTQLHRRAVRPGDEELARNPRARSARLRAGLRTDAPAWSLRRGRAA